MHHKSSQYLKRLPVIHSYRYESSDDRTDYLALFPVNSERFMNYPGYSGFLYKPELDRVRFHRDQAVTYFCHIRSNSVTPSHVCTRKFAMPEATQTRSEFVDFWNEILVPKFIKYKHILVGGLTHHSAAIFPSLPVKTGDKVLDVGCGFGDTAMLLANRVGPTGSVMGIDCCEAFMEYGRKDVAAAGLTNVSFIEGDALTERIEPEYDFVFSRFGTMFFENPVAGLRNMRTALKPGGIMTQIVWRTPADNPWLGMAKEVVLEFLPPPGEDGRSCGPGPFSMSNQESVTKMLEISGYEKISFKRVDAPVLVGNTVEDAIGFQLALGPAGEVFREAGEEAETKRDQVEAALAQAIDKQKSDANGIVMDSSSWVITATNPW